MKGVGVVNLFERGFAIFSLLFMIFASIFVFWLLSLLSFWVALFALPTAIMLIWHAALLVVEVWECD